MISLSTVLSLLKLAEMPYGGSITLASMLPMIIVSYRHGALWGFGAGTVYAAIQQLLGLNNLSYVTGWQSVLAVILLDYMLAFSAVCLGGVLRGRFVKVEVSRSRAQASELAAGALIVCFLRYILHTVAGATVWAGLSIPTEAALIYSIGYNATYMIPETIVNFLGALYLGSIIDFTKTIPERFSSSSASAEAKGVLAIAAPYISGLVAIVATVTDAVLIFPYLQDGESGEFTFAYLSEVSWVAVITVSAIAAAVAIGLLVYSRLASKKAEASAD